MLAAIPELLKRYWNIHVDSYEKIPLGNAVCYKVISDSGNYFVKSLRKDIIESRERLDEIIEVQNFFAGKNLLVLRPVSTKTGETYVQNLDSLILTYPFVSSFHKTQKTELDHRNLFSLAETLAKLHKAGTSQDAPRVSKTFSGWKNAMEFDKSASRIRAELKQRRQLGISSQREELVEESIRIKEKIIHENSINYDDLNLSSDHLTHGDFQERNVFFDKEGNVEWLIDFDTCERAPRARELARAIDLLCIERDSLSVSGLGKARKFFEIYNEIYPMPYNELLHGWFTHLMKTGNSLFAYKDYYFNHDDRAIRFIDGEKTQFLPEYFARLDEIASFLYSP